MDDKNPYVGLLEIMGKEAAALQPSASGGCMTGTVKSVDRSGGKGIPGSQRP